MANEKRTSINFSVVKDGLTNQLVISRQEDLSGTNYLAVVQSVTTASWQAVLITGLASVDLLALKNNDGTNSVDVAIANDGTGIFSTLIAGRGLVLPAKSAAVYYMKASGGTCDVQVNVVEP